MASQIKDLMQQSPEQNEQHCSVDILTDSEKQYHINYAIAQQKKHYMVRMTGKGMSVQEAEKRIAEIDWSKEIDTPSVLQDAANRKQWFLEEEETRKQRLNDRISKIQQLRKEWTADRYLQIIRDHYQNRGGFKMIPDQVTYFQTVAYWLSGDPRFEEKGFRFNRGLLIVGDAGTGKTETLKAVANNPLFPLTIISMIEIAEQVREKGICILRSDRIHVIDDIGSEPVPVKHYGTEINWFKDFIETIYLKQTDYSNVIITTNLGGDEIEKLYGYRVRSRMREMFNSITITGKDLRQ